MNIIPPLPISRRVISRVFAVLLIAAFFFSSGCQSSEGSAAPVAPVSRSLKVAIYPYVPRKAQFVAAITDAWRRVEPNVPLQIVDDWDCYSAEPRADFDVYAFDAIFLDHFRAAGFLEPIPENTVTDLRDFLDYALQGSRIDGTLYGIPQLGCTNILFYRRGDRAVAAAQSLSDLQRALGECTYSGVHPPTGVGLLVDLSGGTTAACSYLAAVEGNYGRYTPAPPLPPDEAKIDPWAIQNLWQMVRMASRAQVQFEDPGYERAAWFGRGEGRALVGFTEAMSNMGEQARANVEFKLMPFSDRGGVALFFADILGVNPTAARRGNRELALKLANLMASTEVMVKSVGPTTGYNYPQYLLPVRRSVFQAFEPAFPLYGKMRQLVESSSPNLFRLTPDSKEWLAAMKKKVRAQIYAAPVCPPQPAPPQPQ